jgi:hypothetical protein
MIAGLGIQAGDFFLHFFQIPGTFVPAVSVSFFYTVNCAQLHP